MTNRSTSFFIGIMVAVLINTGGEVLATEVEMHVNGLVCSFCAQGLIKRLNSIEGVEESKVDLDSESVTIKLKPGKNITDDQIFEEVRAARFSVDTIIRSELGKEKVK